MKVFISWSGERSRKVAELFNEWLPHFIQSITPWISTNMDRGIQWFNAITEQLRDTEIGILCVTKENKDAPWILFEAGALAKGLDSSRICCFLIDVEPSDINAPLAHFNHTLPDKEGVFQLLKTLNSRIDSPLDVTRLGKAYDTFWPEFQKDFTKTLKNTEDQESDSAVSEKEMIREMYSAFEKNNKPAVHTNPMFYYDHDSDESDIFLDECIDLCIHNLLKLDASEINNNSIVEVLKEGKQVLIENKAESVVHRLDEEVIFKILNMGKPGSLKPELYEWAYDQP